MEEPLRLKEDMIERVADAIAGAITRRDTEEPDFGHYREAARAAIQAMREPTAAMLSASEDLTTQSDGTSRSPSHYRAMIDAALQAEGGS